MADAASIDYSALKVTELKLECKNRKIVTTGRKADLIERLQQFDESQKAPKAAASAAGPEDEMRPDYPSWSITQLKAECAHRGFATSGNKTELCERLEGEDAEELIVSQPGYTPSKDEASIATGEVRDFTYRPRPNLDFRERCRKAKSQRLFMLGRQKGSDPRGRPKEDFDIAGSKGSLYTTTIACRSSCNCIDYKMKGGVGAPCKHIVYALVVILRAPEEVAWQGTLLPSEVKGIFANAPVTRGIMEGERLEEMYTGTRKPIDGECPICVFEVSEDDDLVWCKRACGQNFHRECFDQWRDVKINEPGGVTCVYCRQPWISDDGTDRTGVAALKATAPKIGWHQNVADMPFYKNALNKATGVAGEKS